MCFAWIYVCAPCASLVPMEVRHKCQLPQGQQLWMVVRLHVGAGNRTQSSARAASALNCRAGSPALYVFLIWLYLTNKFLVMGLPAQSAQSVFVSLFSSQRQGVTVLPRLASNSWAHVILLPQPTKELVPITRCHAGPAYLLNYISRPFHLWFCLPLFQLLMVCKYYLSCLSRGITLTFFLLQCIITTIQSLLLPVSYCA